jgi:RNA polymerase sigma factor (sigma-70 family)
MSRKRQNEVDKAIEEKFGPVYQDLYGKKFSKYESDEKPGTGYKPPETGPDGEIREDKFANPDQLPSSASPWAQNELSEMEQEELESVNAVCATLTDKQKQIFQLRFVDQLTYEEISNRLGISIRTIRTTADRIQKKILDYHVADKA